MPHTKPLVKQAAAARILVALAAFALAGCGGSSTQTWSGPPKADATGSMPVASFNAYLAGGGRRLAASPVAAVAEFLRLDGADAATTSVVSTTNGEVRDRARVTATLDGLLDDSVRSTRYLVDMEKNGEKWRLRSASVAYRCRRGRGHQAYSPALCS